MIFHFTSHTFIFRFVTILLVGGLSFLEAAMLVLKPHDVPSNILFVIRHSFRKWTKSKVNWIFTYTFRMYIRKAGLPAAAAVHDKSVRNGPIILPSVVLLWVLLFLWQATTWQDSPCIFSRRNGLNVKMALTPEQKLIGVLNNVQYSIYHKAHFSCFKNFCIFILFTNIFVAYFFSTKYFNIFKTDRS